MKVKLYAGKAAPFRAQAQKCLRGATRCHAQEQAALSGDVLAMFHEAQRNILQLNKSRLLALHELRLAKDRICALESICAEAGLDYSGAPSMWAESATAHQYVMTTQPLPSNESDDDSDERPQGLRAALAEAEAEAPQSLNGSAQAVLGAKPSGNNNSQPSGKPDFGKQSYGGGSQSYQSSAPITVEYNTGWSQAYIHHSKSDGSWTAMPGLKMRKDSNAGVFIAELDQEKAEFVFNNGGQDWDGPWNAENYFIDRPGHYRVKNGKVTRMSGSKNNPALLQKARA